MLSGLPAPTLQHGPRHLFRGFCLCSRHRNSRLLFVPTCSALCRLVSPAHMASADFCRTSRHSVSRLPRTGFRPVLDSRSPRVMRVTFTPYTRRIYIHTLPDGYWALKNIAFSPGCACLVCDFCSSGRSFACGFLQIPGRPGHPCRSANGSHHQGP